MEEQTIFEIIHNMDKVTNHLIIKWNKMFDQDLGISHILVLAHLRDSGRSRPSDIAKALGLTPATLTHLSGKLSRKRLIVRAADEDDRRIVYLEITPDGLEMLRRADLEGRRLRGRLFERLNDEEKRQLLAIFAKLSAE
ncbi:MarR family winged helix-turn-helix transcriptional regulator [Paenibacillus glufosinatiresistens]|uniref:MarR family winged helix-turn-helix transcriptional regulator n=1 Tax=Paenibacillus glufosinatiresistens TaxID=3070657 RepID=UPI00286EAE93|nr:MarR family transcriptional regulator [Paenibacillus sp. YX.27]